MPPRGGRARRNGAAPNAGPPGGATPRSGRARRRRLPGLQCGPRSRLCSRPGAQGYRVSPSTDRASESDDPERCRVPQRDMSGNAQRRRSRPGSRHVARRVSLVRLDRGFGRLADRLPRTFCPLSGTPRKSDCGPKSVTWRLPGRSRERSFAALLRRQDCAHLRHSARSGDSSEPDTRTKRHRKRWWIPGPRSTRSMSARNHRAERRSACRWRTPPFSQPDRDRTIKILQLFLTRDIVAAAGGLHDGRA